jgi:hypothetical protein
MRQVAMPRKAVVPAIVIVAIIVVGGVGYYFYNRYQAQQRLLQDPAAAAQDTVNKVSKLIELPAEQPRVAVVSDLEKLKGQPFFANAKLGDKVLLYTGSKKAIIYRPSTNKLVEVGPINVQEPATSSGAVVDDYTKAVTVALYNGTTTNGLTTKFEPELKKVLPNASVTERGNALNDDTAKTLVVILNEQFKSQAELLAKSLNASVADLPEGEKRPQKADLLVILGKDRAQ